MEQKREINKENAAAILLLFWKFAKKFPKELTISFIFLPANVILLFTMIPWFISRIVQQLTIQAPITDIVPYLLAVAACAFFGLTCNFIGYKANFRHQALGFAEVIRTCFDALSRRGEQFYANQFTGALTKYTIDFPSSYSTIEIAVFTQILPLLVRILSGVIIVIIGGAPAVALLLLVMTFSTLYMFYNSRKSRQAIRTKRRIAQTAINSHLADIITNNQTMRTFAQWDGEKATNHRLVKKWTGLMNQDFGLMNKLFNRMLQVNLFMQIIVIAALVFLVNSGSIEIGIAVFCITYLSRFAAEILSIGGIINQVENALIDAVPMMRILEEGQELQDREDAGQLTVSEGAVLFDNVSFAYIENSDQTVLSNFTLNIKPGEKIGLVGPSGGGKTTITKLLLRLLDVQHGSILIDSQDIVSVTQESLRKNIAYVPQEPLLFHRSLAENISYAKPKASKQQILKAAKEAHADDFIQKLPAGYDTMVGERGVKLSGGQRQRVAIARAMLKDAPILILDEATSALDSESESLVQDALWKLMQDRTAIVIAHRLSTIQKMDRIIVLEEGKIVEEGSHKDLLQKKGTYAKLWKHQSGGFLEE